MDVGVCLIVGSSYLMGLLSLANRTPYKGQRFENYVETIWKSLERMGSELTKVTELEGYV